MRFRRAILAGLLFLGTVTEPLLAAGGPACCPMGPVKACACAGARRLPRGPAFERACCCRLAPLPDPPRLRREPLARSGEDLPLPPLAALPVAEAPGTVTGPDPAPKASHRAPRAPPRARHLVLGVLLC